MTRRQMALATLQKRIARIERMRDDDESAHYEEDVLRHDVLVVIASGAANAQELAREVLKTSDIQFSRWYA